MPLEKGKSPNAFKHNIKAEMHAGKPLKQSLAIAYAMKRKKMAMGGMVDNEEAKADEAQYGHVTDYAMVPLKDPDDAQYLSKSENPYLHGMAEKGEMSHGGLVDRIMKKHYSMGGVVSNEGEDEMDHLADGKPNEFDDLVLDDHLEGEQPMDSNEHGNAAEEEREKQMVAMIMKKHKDRNPRPA